MDVDWNEEEKHDLGFTLSGHAGGNTLAAAVAVGSRAVELIRARGGTMTARDRKELREALTAGTDIPHVRTCLSAALDDLVAQGATVATLQEKVEELEAVVAERQHSLEQMHDSAETEISELRAEVERLKARTWIQCTMTSNDCLGGCRSLEEHDRYRHQALLSEVERLKGWREKCINDNNAWAARLTAAEYRIAAILERYADGVGVANAVDRDRRQAAEYEVVHTEASAVMAGIRWVLEGDAPQEAKSAAQEAVELAGAAGLPVRIVPERYPCSHTCTHDDAANPGHPERVKERSEAMWKIVAPDAPQDSSAAACEGDASWTAGFEFGKEQGAEAMRAALLIEAKAACDQHGVGWLYQHLKRRFESATP